MNLLKGFSSNNDFMHDSWLSALIAIDISLLVNRLSTLTEIGWGQLMSLCAVLGATLLALLYFKLKADTLSQIERQIAAGGDEGKIVTVAEEFEVRQVRLKMVSGARSKLEVLALCFMIFALGSIVWTNSFETREAKAQLSELRKQSDGQLAAVGSVSASVNSLREEFSLIRQEVEKVLPLLRVDSALVTGSSGP